MIAVVAHIELAGAPVEVHYAIEVEPEQNGRPAVLLAESLHLEADSRGGYIFRVDTFRDDLRALRVWVRKWSVNNWRRTPPLDFSDLNTLLNSGELRDRDPRLEAYNYDTIVPQRTALSQIAESTNTMVPVQVRQYAQALLAELASMRFLDLHPDAMRQPSFPGQLTLGDRGENLSSVLQAICIDPQRRETLVGWLQALTPMDAANFDFPADQIGRVLATLIEADGRRTTAYSASDGTLRFLAMLAALLGPEAARLYMFEELENGIHPTRLHLLLQLIEQQVATGSSQVIASTHSPQLLRLIAPQTLATTSLLYRLPGEDASQIRRLLDIPDVEQTLADEDLARLHESGWLEDAIAFTAQEDAVGTSLSLPKIRRKIILFSNQLGRQCGRRSIAPMQRCTPAATRSTVASIMS
ncbi:ATP-binding protein [Candidatus Gracilibacteria bacterium]|nr:ATP-binding protein [Candidatus Gracilibacteria bacterium]